MLKAIQNRLHNYAVYKTRSELMRLSDRQLQDVGISRDLLTLGVSHWPWREESLTDKTADQPARLSASEVNQAVRQLSDMTDHELADLGIRRGAIRHAVINGVDGRAA